jgi:glycosyltransferase involved in cell wall biosynthesis
MVSILHVIDTGGPGGAETVFLNCSTRLDLNKFASTAVVGSDNWLARRLRENGLEPIIAPAHGSFNFRYFLHMAAIARKTNADLIVAHLYGSAVYASAVGRICSIPVVSVFHGAHDIAPGSRFNSIKASIVRNGSARVVFVSQNLRDELTATLRIPSSRSLVIPNGVDTTAFKPGRDDSVRKALRLPADGILVGSVGNVRAPKAYDNLLRAARILKDRSDRFYFVIAGECSGTLADDLLRLRNELKLDGCVSFIGLRDDIPTVLHNLDIFVLSSKSEGFSISCVEAMACGIPVVATRCGGPQEILDKCSGILVAPESPSELADAINRVALTPELATQIAGAALKRVHDEFSLATMLSKYAVMYEDIVHEDRR